MSQPVIPWEQQGCAACRAAWSTATREPLRLLGINLEMRTRVHRCDVCLAYWEETERFARHVPDSEAALLQPSVLTIDSMFVPVDRIWRPDMSLSSARVGGYAATYCLRIKVSDLVHAIEPAYDSCVAELKSDDALVGETDFFGQAGYPPLATLLTMDVLARVVDTYFATELFRAILPEASTGPGTYAIEGVHGIRIAGEEAFIEGPCYAFQSEPSRQRR